MENHTSTADSKDPASFLSSLSGVPVTVKLNSGVVYKGELQSVDGYMNIALEKCQEFVDGQLRRTYGDAFVRGNNGEYLECNGHQVADRSSAVYLERMMWPATEVVTRSLTVMDLSVGRTHPSRRLY